MEKIEKVRKWLWLVLLVGFIGVGIAGLDPDYGWHVGMGRYVLEHGIPKTDPFSYTMPSYPFVDHEWFLNILMYWSNQVIGKNGLAIIFGFLVVVALYQVPRKRGWEMAILLAAGVLIARGGVRPQVLTWMLIALMWNWWQTKPQILPILFIVWVNLHGGFAIGLLMLLFMLVAKSIEDGKWQMAHSKAWLLSFVVTFINPYGWRIWWEVWMQFTDTELRANISEWQPFYAAMEPAVWFLAVLWIMLVVWEVRHQKWVKWKLATITVLLLAGLLSLRHMAIFAVVVCLELPEMLERFWQTIKGKERHKRADQVYALFVVLAYAIFGLAAVITSVNFWRFTNIYPVGAVEFLKKENFSDKVFSDYAFGGYLIWQIPEKKVFIDGRMPSWRRNAHVISEGLRGGESENAMMEYLKVVKELEYQEIFDKYGIGVALLPKPAEPSWFDKKILELANSIKRSLGGASESERVRLLEKLQKDGWRVAYEDKISIILLADKNEQK